MLERAFLTKREHINLRLGAIKSKSNFQGHFTKYAVPGDRKSLQNIVDNMIAASSSSNLDCMKDCVINLHALGDAFDLNHEERTCVFAAAECAHNLETGNDIASVYDMLDMAGFAKDSQILHMLNDIQTSRKNNLP